MVEHWNMGCSAGSPGPSHVTSSPSVFLSFFSHSTTLRLDTERSSSEGCQGNLSTASEAVSHECCSLIQSLTDMEAEFHLAIDGPFVTLSETFIDGLGVSSLTRVRRVKYMRIYSTLIAHNRGRERYIRLHLVVRQVQVILRGAHNKRLQDHEHRLS